MAIPLLKCSRGDCFRVQPLNGLEKAMTAASEGSREEATLIAHQVAGELAPDGLAGLNSGLSFKGSRPASIKVSWQNETRLRFALKGVQPGQIQHMCNQVGLEVVSMKRLRVGRVPMAALPVGQWRYLLGYERF